MLFALFIYPETLCLIHHIPQYLFFTCSVAYKLYFYGHFQSMVIYSLTQKYHTVLYSRM